MTSGWVSTYLWRNSGMRRLLCAKIYREAIATLTVMNISELEAASGVVRNLIYPPSATRGPEASRPTQRQPTYPPTTHNRLDIARTYIQALCTLSYNLFTFMARYTIAITVIRLRRSLFFNVSMWTVIIGLKLRYSQSLHNRELRRLGAPPTAIGAQTPLCRYHNESTVPHK